jgi:hypothetical protein
MSSDEKDSEKSTPDEAASKRPGVAGWDRVGDYLGRWNDAGKSIAERHLNVWKDISADLRNPEYGADEWARGGARFAATALDDAQDLWRVLAPQAVPPVTGEIQNVLLEFEVDEYRSGGEDALPPVQSIPVPSSVQSPPERVRIALYGSCEQAAKALREAIHVTLDEKDRKYVIQCTAPVPVRALVPGIYAGLISVALDGSQMTLADLRVVVKRRGES